MAPEQRPSLTEALSQYIPRLKAADQRDGQQELNRFIQWCGRDRGVDKLTPPEVAGYAESASLWGADSAKKLKPIKAFLTYLKDRRLTGISLAPHLKASRSKANAGRVYFKASSDQVELSPEGYANLQSRLELLKQERVRIVGDIRRAMADKDFKENAPLDAAKERQGFIESGIKDLESIILNAVVTSTQAGHKYGRVRLGTKVTLRDASSGKKVHYTLVDSREADPVSGKISGVSPVGKALLNKAKGEEVYITVPRGTLHYFVEKIQA